MENDTETTDAAEPPGDEALLTSGHVERTILHHMTGEDADRSAPTTVSGVLDDVAGVIERGDYANIGPKGAAGATVRKSTIRRTFSQLAEKGLVRRVEDLAASELRDSRFDLGPLDADGVADDPAAYARTSDDARVTDWVLTDEGRREVQRLDARYAAELDELAARYGRPHGETTDRIDA
ncbi:hypothetical protein [Halorussus sp. MSC15.2]|uniref:hypothetical protein n=1 Tax=Halorussus sp. MSC15.2 TaxID=2283638 RepID=UPI0013D61F12|nr:hypothetical protein [Halorussus sp. MSC15.2]NEU58459.1 hypothetical protein [Halorussus sp. MSC15.2]